ncbi:Methyltransferase-like protein 25 [Chionoecetes opilio]|uniref:Methyltransferase-like protein 25 n=1 Tax=Chionoecetes opilio TaxID=41210 RepID=A0A8J4Y2G8_CHIOP|nr:Methyltransferase-like protein 25 [Chionoecetes opilio]
MASLQQVNEALDKMVTFLGPLMPLIGCHMVDYLTQSHWDTLLPAQLQRDLLSLPAEALHQLPSATLPQRLGVTWLVDLGSGRGYLSTSLVLQYGQQVVAIDSSSSNTSSALVRNTKLKRLWDNLRQTWHHQSEGRPVKKGKSRRRKGVTKQRQQEEEQSWRQEDVKDHNVRAKGENLPTHLKGCFFGMTKFVTEDTDLLELVRCAAGSEKVRGEDKNALVRNDIEFVPEKVISGSKAHPVDSGDTEALSHPHNSLKRETHISTPTKDNNIRKQAQDSPSADTTCQPVDETSVLGMVGLHTCGNLASSSLRLFVANPRVKLLCNVGCCYHLIEEEFSRNTYNQRKTPEESGMSGSSPLVYNQEENCVPKHTGGEHNLTLMKRDDNSSQSSTSHEKQGGDTDYSGSPHRTDSVPSSGREACVAPSRLPSNTTEKHYKDPPSPLLQVHPEAATAEGEGDIDPLHPSRIPNLGHGFPLSSFLRNRRFSLGRNGRMLSSQAADRLTRGNTGGGDCGLYWRALLQVVLEDRLGDVSELSHVGRLTAKCDTFVAYARTAMARLGVSIQVTEEELDAYDQQYSSSKDKLERFFLLRASLAAVVEGAVLLDRLAFLCDQEDTWAYLVPLFDPVTSPRSHALVAVRKG